MNSDSIIPVYTLGPNSAKYVLLSDFHNAISFVKEMILEKNKKKKRERNKLYMRKYRKKKKNENENII